MRRLRIALVLNRFYPEVGGAETNLYFQACELAKHHDVTVFTPLRRSDTPAFERINGFFVHRLKDWKNIPVKYPNNGRDTLMGGVFFRILFGNYDIVQAFPALNKNNMLALLACKLKGTPFILTVFDLIDYAEVERLTGTVDNSSLQRFQPGLVMRKCLKACSHIFAISNREIEVLRKFNSNVSFSPVPVKPDEFESSPDDVRGKYGVAKDAMLFLVLGRVSRLKGQDLAVKAFVKAAAAMPGSVMAVVGRNDYEPDLNNEMKRLVEENGLSKRVLFTGMLERHEVISFLQQSDIHVIPVRFMNSGAVVVESWAGGTPVIQSDAVDPNLVVENENGYVFPCGDVNVLADKMIAAYHDRPRLMKMGANGRKLVIEKFTYDNLIRIYESVYSKLLP
ncbi:MAG: glycosyltransferase family 4 protein [Victivallales bacterium]|nr:glycosyltransferase family 4 protein [Victivallales bacterium]